MTLNLTPGRRLLLLALTFVACFCLFSVMASLVRAIGLMDSARGARVMTVLQDVIVFILPALVTAMLVTRQPAELLCLRTRIPWLQVIIGIVTLIVAVPIMNAVVTWNASLSLPASMHGLEQWMQTNEQASTSMINMVMGGASVKDLIMAICIVGVQAAVSEELLFRGALQRLLSTGGLRPWMAVLFTAAVFSAIHMQFYGFVPRLLLGAFLGYLLVCTRCLWVPILVHFYNNSAYVVSRWMELRQSASPIPEGADNEANLLVMAVSTLLTLVCLWLLWRLSQRRLSA